MFRRIIDAAQADGWLFLLLGLILVLAWLRRDLIQRALFALEDPRTFAILRICFAFLAIWNFVNLFAHWRMLWMDEGLLSVEEIQIRTHALRGWHPDEGFYDWGAFLHFVKDIPSPFLFWKTPAFVYAYLGSFFLVCTAFGVGLFSRVTGVLAWLMLHTIYHANHLYTEGTDLVFRCFWFILLFAKTGHAWSVDNWLRCRRLRARGKLQDPDASDEENRGKEPIYRLVPAWPRYGFIVQLVFVYFITGLLKTGKLWFNGDALYYALNSIRFHRFEGITQFISALFGTSLFRLMTWVTHWWERLFPLVLVGVGLKLAARHRPWLKNEPWRIGAIRGLGVLFWAVAWRVHVLCLHAVHAKDADELAIGLTWVHIGYGALVPALVALWFWLGWLERRGKTYVLFRGGIRAAWLTRVVPGASSFELPITRELLRGVLFGRRLWLSLGVLFHGFLILFMNLGVFPFITLATYLGYYSGEELRAFGERSFHGLRARFSAFQRMPERWARALLPAGSLVVEDGAKDRPPRLAYPPVGRVLVFAGILYHLVAVTWVVSGKLPEFKASRNLVAKLLNPRDWLDFTRTSQVWKMFAPNPARVNILLRTVVVDESKKRHEIKNNPLHYRSRVWLTYDRMGKMQYKLARERTWLDDYWAAYHCRQWQLETGSSPVRVELYRLTSRIPSPEKAQKQGGFDSRALKLRAKRLKKYSCRGLGELPILMKERYGLPITERDRKREASRRREYERKWDRIRRSWERKHGS